MNGKRARQIREYVKNNSTGDPVSDYLRNPRTKEIILHDCHKKLNQHLKKTWKRR